MNRWLNRKKIRSLERRIARLERAVGNEYTTGVLVHEYDSSGNIFLESRSHSLQDAVQAIINNMDLVSYSAVGRKFVVRQERGDNNE